MARSSDRRMVRMLFGSGPRDMPADERSDTPRWVRQQNEIEAVAAWSSEDERGPLFGRYELVDTIGSGAYGCVFKAHDPRLDRIVAIKRCTNESPHAARVLLGEALALAQLSDDNIIRILDSGEDQGDVFYVMEYANGGTLEAFALKGEDGQKREQPRSWRELVPLFMGVARGLAAAHGAGVVHGDIKPANILLHEGRPLIADFGLARVIGSPTLMPGAVGTLAFAAREVLAGQVRDELSDQWSFFVALWYCLEGELPFKNPDADSDDSWQFWSSEEAVMRAIDAWPGVSSLRADIPESLREMLRVGLSMDPADRFPDMDTVARELSKVAALGVTDGPVMQPSNREPARSPWRGHGLGAMLVVVAVGLLGEVYLATRRTASDTAIESSSPRDPAPIEQPNPEPEPVEQPEPEDNGPEGSDDPCAADGVPITPDPSVESTCRALSGDHRAAGHLWDEVAAGRESSAATSQDWLKLACDTVSLAQTQLRLAKTSDPERAGELREMAKRYAQVARDDYLTEVDGEETAKAVSQVESVIARILDDDLGDDDPSD